MTTLAELAPELLLEISDFLPPADLCCFAVCNHRHYCLLSMMMELLPPLTPKEKSSILIRMERDTPQYFACEGCNLLHRYDGSESFGLSGFFPKRTCPLPCVHRKDQLSYWFDERETLVHHVPSSTCIQKLSFLHLKLAMRRFKYGPECGISTDSLSHVQVKECSMPCTFRTVTWLFSREAQICTKPLGLYLRTQDILLVSMWRDLIEHTFSSDDPLAICIHDKFVRRKLDPILKLHANEEKNFVEIRPARCTKCHTICDYELYEIDGRKSLVITKWFNLGPGLDEKDPKWRTHTYVPCNRRQYYGFDPGYPVGEYCPKRRFEETAPQSLMDLRLRNFSYLRDNEFKKIMRYAYGWHTWHDPFREPSTNILVNFGRSLQALFGWFPDPVFK